MFDHSHILPGKIRKSIYVENMLLSERSFFQLLQQPGHLISGILFSPADLKQASLETEGSLAQKLEELSLLMEAYDSLCSRGKQDPRDQMTWLL
ncbi:MAG: hypothetical protein IJB15_08710, partial [Clostridia bacterium]|nr:hypothetical protein [Clostridia bacterium]